MPQIENVTEMPVGLDPELIRNSLQKAFQDKDLEVVKYSINSAIARGENYLSQIFRVNAEIKSSKWNHKNFSFLVKSLPQGQESNDYIAEFLLFEKEAKMLSEIIPKIHQHLSKAGYSHKLAAEVYYSQGRPNDLIILEDLCPLGYKIAD